MAINYYHEYNVGIYFHIYNHAIENQNLYNIDNDYKKFLHKYQEYFQSYFDTLAYCLMPNHYHFLVRVKSIEQILLYLENNEESKAIQNFKENKITLDKLIEDQFRRLHSSYSLYYKARYQNVGALFSKRHKHVAFNPEQKLIYLLCYIHHNPIHHKYTLNYEDWKYSTFQHYFSDNNTFLMKQEILDLFDSTKDLLTIHNNFKLLMNENNNID